jgi:hypothetical protein
MTPPRLPATYMVDQVVSALSHDFANLLNLISLLDESLDVSNYHLTLKFTRAVYMDVDTDDLLYELTQMRSQYARALLMVLWYTKNNTSDLEIQDNCISCDANLVDINKFHAYQYLELHGYSFKGTGQSTLCVMRC